MRCHLSIAVGEEITLDGKRRRVKCEHKGERQAWLAVCVLSVCVCCFLRVQTRRVQSI